MPLRISGIESRRARGLLATILLCASAGSGAGDMADAPFGLRFNAALSRFSTYGDVTGVGGASAGAPVASSANPAGSVWSERGARTRSFSPQAIRIAFDHGTEFRVGIGSLAWNSGAGDRIELSVARSRSNEALLPAGAAFVFDSDQLSLGWARRLDAHTAVGLDLGITGSNSALRARGFELDRSKSDSLGLSAGVMRALDERWTAGLVAGLSQALTSSRQLVFLPAPTLVARDVQGSQALLRGGLSYRVPGWGYLLLDYQYGHFRADGESLSVQRLYAGAGFRLIGWLNARLGGNIDDDGGRSMAIGLGLNPSPAFSLELAFQKDAFPEVEPEFGDARLVNLSLSINF